LVRIPLPKYNQWCHTMTSLVAAQIKKYDDQSYSKVS
jgi:hypothetical protein